jgi:hypothetical protein
VTITIAIMRKLIWGKLGELPPDVLAKVRASSQVRQLKPLQI